MLQQLRRLVWAANRELPRQGLVTYTWGNVSAIDRDRGLVVIKPSGVAYEELTPENLVVVALADGRVVEGDLRPSSDTATHLELYRAFPAAGASYTPTAPTPRPGPRPGGTCPVTAPPTRTTFTARCPAPVP